LIVEDIKTSFGMGANDLSTDSLATIV